MLTSPMAEEYVHWVFPSNHVIIPGADSVNLSPASVSIPCDLLPSAVSV